MTMTPGQALWNLDRPLEDFPNRKPWEELDERQRQLYGDRAMTILNTVDAISKALAQVEPPWDDLKVAYGIEDHDALWDWYNHKGEDALPNGWELNEVDGSGARCVAIFRVNGSFKEQDAEQVKILLSSL